MSIETIPAIPIENIYYMLSYYFKFDALNNKIKNVNNTQKFETIADLTSQILIRGVNILSKRGFAKEYILCSEALSTLKGKIDISDSIKTMSFNKKRLICLYDNFSINFYLNRIIKTAICELLKFDIPKEIKERKEELKRKKELRKILHFFNEVETIEIHKINWNIQYNRNNQIYRILISVCHLFIKGLLISDLPKNKKNLFLNTANEKYMSTLYEKFILNYYASKFKDEIKSTASQIDWAIEFNNNNYNDIKNNIEMLPKMQTDIMLTCMDKTKIKNKNKILIIDAKYYSKPLKKQFDKDKIDSNNLYQIFSYVKNKSLENTDYEVSGMLLYAKTNKNNIDINESYNMSGNKIIVRSLDLTCSFNDIAKQLNEIKEDWLK